MSLGHGSTIIRENLIFHIDAASSRSYPGSGTTWYDLSGNGNHGTLQNSITYSSANRGYFDFDGVDDYVSFGNVTSANPISLAGTLQQSWCFWFNPVESGDIAQRLIDKSTGGGGIGGYFISLQTTISESGPGYLYAKINNDTTDSLEDIFVDYQYNAWNYLCVTRINNTTNGWKIYLNGELVIQGNSTDVTVPSTTAPLNIGTWYSGTDREMNGKISCVQIYDRAITASEVKQNFIAARGRYGI